jgi:hypothetical protein
LRGLVYIRFSCKYVGKEYGINHEANSDSNFLAAGCFFSCWNAVAARLNPALLLKHLDNTKLIVCQNNNLFFSSSFFFFFFFLCVFFFLLSPWKIWRFVASNSCELISAQKL